MHRHCSAIASTIWHAASWIHLSFRLHHFPRSVSQHVPDISLLLHTGVSQPDLHTAPTTQTPRHITTPHTSSIFYSRMKYAWMCARHLPSLGLRSPQEARLICNWEVCWINQQFIRFLIEITLSKNTNNTGNSNNDPCCIVFCLLSISICMLTNGLLRFREILQLCWESEFTNRGISIVCGEFFWCLILILCSIVFMSVAICSLSYCNLLVIVVDCKFRMERSFKYLLSL